MGAGLLAVEVGCHSGRQKRGLGALQVPRALGLRPEPSIGGFESIATEMSGVGTDADAATVCTDRVPAGPALNPTRRRQGAGLKRSLFTQQADRCVVQARENQSWSGETDYTIASQSPSSSSSVGSSQRVSSRAPLASVGHLGAQPATCAPTSLLSQHVPPINLVV